MICSVLYLYIFATSTTFNCFVYYNDTSPELNPIEPSEYPEDTNKILNKSEIKTRSAEKQSWLKWLFMVYVLIGFTIVFLILITVLVIIRRRLICRSKKSREVPTAPQSVRYSKAWEEIAGVAVLQKDMLKILSEIGEGCFGKVYKGNYSFDGTEEKTVAVKILKDDATEKDKKDFYREVNVMNAFRHANVLSLLGVVLRDQSSNPMIVCEYMSHRDLADLLRTDAEKEVPELTVKDLLHMALQIARGMNYLSELKFVHRDLACRNCLVGEKLVVKIADFGMSRDVYNCNYYKLGSSHLLLPVRWMSPESLAYGRFTFQSDVWSYGVVLWEIYSFGKLPYYGHTNDQAVKLILKRSLLEQPDDCPFFIRELMESCWEHEPKNRIKFSRICYKLEIAYENLSEPLELILGREEFQPLRGWKQRLSTLEKPLTIRQSSMIAFGKQFSIDDGYLSPRDIELTPYLDVFPG